MGEITKVFFFLKRCLKLLPFVHSLPLRLCEVVESVPGITGFKAGSRWICLPKKTGEVGDFVGMN